MSHKPGILQAYLNMAQSSVATVFTLTPVIGTDLDHSSGACSSSPSLPLPRLMFSVDDRSGFA